MLRIAKDIKIYGFGLAFWSMDNISISKITFRPILCIELYIRRIVKRQPSFRVMIKNPVSGSGGCGTFVREV
jgi:hypothetical protein